MNNARHMLMTLAFVAPLIFLNGAQAQQAPGQPFDDLQAQIDALTARVADLEGRTRPLALTVDCAAGQTVASALAQAARTFRGVTITIVGLCEESVTIFRDNVRLQGASVGDGLEAPPSSAWVLRISHAHQVSLDQLTLVGGDRGLRSDGGNFTASNLHVKDAAFRGVEVGARGYGAIRNSIIENTGRDGLAVDSGGTVHISGSATVVRNNQTGLWAGNNGYVSLFGEAAVTSNRSGVRAFNGGVVRIGEAAIVKNNDGDGVSIAIGSTLNVTSGAIIRGNGGHGISLRDTSVAELGSADNPPQVNDNGGWGIICAPAPGVAQLGVGVATVTGNAQGQINCPVAPLP